MLNLENIELLVLNRINRYKGRRTLIENMTAKEAICCYLRSQGFLVNQDEAGDIADAIISIKAAESLPGIKDLPRK
jgi:hypothetical protein